jgi:hypothetical protein
LVIRRGRDGGLVCGASLLGGSNGIAQRGSRSGGCGAHNF